MADYYETTHDKFVFRVAKDRLYSSDDYWVMVEEGSAAIGLTDFKQQVTGDIVTVEIETVGKEFAAGDRIATVESIKAVVDVASPITGRIMEANAVLADSPETINEDPYGQGWLVHLKLPGSSPEHTGLLSPESYFELMKKKIVEELEKRK